MEKLILIKYGELTTKSKNRNSFIKRLVKNINNLLKGYDFKITYDRVRMYIEVENDIDIFALKLAKIFGIHSIVICHKTNTNIDDIKDKVLEILSDVNFKTFKVVTKRSDKKFPISSMDFNCLIGGLVLKTHECYVDVHNPEITVNIEIRESYTYIYTNEIKGSGGYPVGIQGKGLLLLSGGIDSPVAGYLALKRGLDIECLYFESPPHTSVEAKNKVISLASIINAYSGNIIVHVVPFTEIQEAIYKHVPSNYMITIMRRMMYRIAEEYAKKRDAGVIINGENIGQVASQTIKSMSVINNVVTIPVIRPVVCLDKNEIIDLAKKIDTYETSILPFEDCCTIFLPKHPIINPNLSKCEEYEQNFNYQKLIVEAISGIETITNLSPKKYDNLL